MLTVDRDVKPRNINFAKVERGGGGGWGSINREGAFIAINTVAIICHSIFAFYTNLQQDLKTPMFLIPYKKSLDLFLTPLPKPFKLIKSILTALYN